MNNSKNGRLLFQYVLAIFIIASGLLLMGQSAPTASTAAASSVGYTEAVLNGTVNANGESTTVIFEYGLTTAYGRSVSAAQNPVSGFVDTAVSAVADDLSPNTTYHFRVKAQNAVGTVYGADMTFTTGVSAPTATTRAASGVGTSGATLNGTVNANYDSTIVTFEYGLTAAYGTTVTADQSPLSGGTNSAVSKVISGLTAGTTYHYRVVAQNSSGTTYGADMTFYTSSAGPTAVTGAVSNITDTTAILNGTVNANFNSTTVTFEWGPTTAYGRTAEAEQSPLSGSVDTAVSAAADDLVPNTTYHYRVKAQNSSGTVYGADMVFTTTASAPTAVTESAADVSASGATLRGTVDAKNDSTTVTFEYGPTAAYGATVTADQSPLSGIGSSAVSKAISGLTAGTTYHYRVVAQNSSGTTYGADMTFYTGSAGPTASTAAATNVTTTTATLNGTVNANNTTTTVTFEYGPTTAYGRTAIADQSPVSGSVDTAVSAVAVDLFPNTTYHYRVKAQNGAGTAYGADMTFLTGNTPTVTTAPVTKITTKKAKSGGNVIDEGGSPVTVRGVCWSTSPHPTTADRFTVNDSGPGPFVSTLNKLTSNTTYYVRAYATNSYGTAYGEELQFTTNSADIKVTIKRPRRGQEVSGKVKIKAVARGSSGSQSIAMVEFYIDDTLIRTRTKVPFKASWNTTSYSNGSHTIKAVAYGKGGESSTHSITVTVNNAASSTSDISINRERLNFSAVPGSEKDFLVTGVQVLSVSGASNWNIAADAGWLSASPSSGKGARVVEVSVNPEGMPAGSYSGSLQIIDPGSSDVLSTVNVRLTIYHKGETTAPFGYFETPLNGAAVENNIPVSGWVLDDIEVKSVSIYRNPLAGEDNSLIYIGDAELVDGARPDMEQKYRDFPLNYKTGWGYLLNTSTLPNRSGAFTLYAEAEDIEGNIITLGSKTITLNNASGVKPFGIMYTLTEAGIVEGLVLRSYGWALTPRPATIPKDGSTITVWVDGVPVGNPVYNTYRKDIAALFPDYNNSSGAGAHFNLDTSSYANGMHTIAWSVQDDSGNMSHLGSRYFYIVNSGAFGKPAPTDIPIRNLQYLEQVETYRSESVSFKKGYNLDAELEALPVDDNGTGIMAIKELERVELHWGDNIAEAWGYLVIDGQLRDLPAGSTLDYESGRFSWLPGPGYFGEFPMIFVLKDKSGSYTHRFISITIEPKFEK